MKRTWKMTSEQRYNAIERYLKGEPLSIIAKDYSVSKRSIRQLGKRYLKRQRLSILKKT